MSTAMNKVLKISKPTLSAQQIKEVLRCLPDEQERLVVLLLSVTGLRVSEAIALRWMDFEDGPCQLSINRTLYKGKLKESKTEAGAACLKLHSSVVALLLRHKDRSSFQSSEDFIFCQANGQPLSYWVCLNHLRQAMKDAGITVEGGKHGFRIFRHSAGSLLYEKSRDLKLVQGAKAYVNSNQQSFENAE